MAKMLEAGDISVNGVVASNAKAKVAEGDLVQIVLEAAEESHIQPQDIALEVVYEDDHVLAFNDINPQAPVHVLVIPKGRYVNHDHFANDASDAEIIGYARAIGEVCKRHNLWIVSDEVYEQLVYRGTFASPFDQTDLADRTIVVSSISKSHAAPGFRSGWCVGPDWFTIKMQGLAETILFGNQPFIADMTAHALNNPDDTSARMAENYQRRIALLEKMFAGSNTIKPLLPDAGMFMLLDITGTGRDGATIAEELLDHAGVATMPGDAFGQQASGFVRLSLTVDDAKLEEAAKRIIAHLSD